MVKNRIILSTALAVVGYFLGIVADATRDTGLAIYYFSCVECWSLGFSMDLNSVKGKGLRKVPPQPNARAQMK